MLILKYIICIIQDQVKCINNTQVCTNTIIILNFGGVLASSAIDRGFEPRSGQTKDNTIDICYFSAIHGALKGVRVMVFSAIFNNISVISWRSVLTAVLGFDLILIFGA